MANRRAIVVANGVTQQIPSGDFLEADIVLLKGTTDATMRSNAGTIEARNPANTAYASLRSSDTVINGIRTSISSTAPSSPAVGDRWVEVDGSNNSLFGWYWWWDGTYWRSSDLSFECSRAAIAAADVHYFAVDTRFSGCYLKFILAQSNVAATSNATNYWTIALSRIAATASTAIQSITTAANTAANWTTTTTLIGVAINNTSTGAKVFALNFTKTLSPGALSVACKIIYNIIR